MEILGDRILIKKIANPNEKKSSIIKSDKRNSNTSAYAKVLELGNGTKIDKKIKKNSIVIIPIYCNSTILQDTEIIDSFNVVAVV